MYIGGLDVGSGGCKLTISDERGNFVGTRYIPYEAKHTDRTHTIDTSLILSSVGRLLSDPGVRLDALGVTSFGESFVLLDENDAILNEPMLYNDPRGSEECVTFDREKVENTCCMTPTAIYTLPKLMWTRIHRPDLMRRTKKIMLMTDFVIYTLTGERVINYSAAARTMGFDIRKKRWSEDIFAHAGIDTTLMPTPVPDGTIVGTSSKFGLSGTKIITAMHDQNAASVGAGALTPGDAVDGSGSVECVTPIVSSLPDDNGVYRAGATFQTYEEGMYSGCAMSYTGGAAVRWYRDNFGGGDSYRELDGGICSVKDNGNIDYVPGGILMMPHLAGAASPYMDPGSRALIYGMTLGSTKYDLYKAVLEGVAYEIRVNLGLLKKADIRPKRLLATGGGAKSRVWNQIKADITGLPITTSALDEVGAAGVIMSCARALGVYGSLKDAAPYFVKEADTYLPDDSRRRIYDELFGKYERMYDLSLQLR